MSRHGTSSLAYLAQKLMTAMSEVKVQMHGSTSVTLTEVFAKGLETFNRQLTAVGVITGAAMAPTLNAAAISDPDARERFLLRRIPSPAAKRNLFEGDVVAFHSPLSLHGRNIDTNRENRHVLVRRVASIEGEELISGNDEHNPEDMFRIPEGHCWVLADNENLKPTEAMDSRVFGPIPLTNILGR